MAELQAPEVKGMLLNLAEENVKAIIKDVVRPYAEYYIKKSSNKVDDIILPFMDQLEAAMLGLADKIDGEVG